MKSVLLITDVHFWRSGAGHRAKIARMVEFLSKRTRLSIAFILPPFIQEDDKEEIEKKFSIQIVFLSEKLGTPLSQLGDKLQGFLSTNKIDCCIIEFIHLSVFLRFIDIEVMKILDTHDITCDRAVSYGEHNYNVFSMSKDTEVEVLNIFDYVMSICEPDYQRLRDFLPEERIINVPHVPRICYTPTNESVMNIGFVGNAFTPNIDGILYFIRECWSNISTKYPFLHLNIFGYVGNVLNNWEIFKYKNIHLKGYLADLDQIYDQIDIAINPVQFGAGIKIKTVEALAYGKPLIATPHSSRGLESGRNYAYLLAEDNSDFENAIEKLVSDFSFRKQLSQRALEYVKETFSEEKCYEPLIRVINNTPEILTTAS